MYLLVSVLATFAAHILQLSGPRCLQEVRDAVSEGKISQEEVDAARAAGEEIYIGFDKADTGPRQGRKGRTLMDDPSRYPDRDPLTGGWAGGTTSPRVLLLTALWHAENKAELFLQLTGEIGLKQFVEV